VIKGRNLIVYPDPDMRLAVSRCVALETTRGWRIAKEKASHKIDVVVAMAMAALAAVREGQDTYVPGTLARELGQALAFVEELRRGSPLRARCGCAAISMMRWTTPPATAGLTRTTASEPCLDAGRGTAGALVGEVPTPVPEVNRLRRPFMSAGAH
jgi:hypothetical protein